MKFKNSIAWQNLSQFESMRTSLDSFLLFSVVDYFQSKRILEIGYREGYSFGLMLQASHPNATLDAVDPTFAGSKIFEYIVTNKKYTFYEMSSMDFDYNGTYDFINVDGNHEYEYALTDINNAVDHLSPNGILMIDDYSLPGVDRAITEMLSQNLMVKPVLKGLQQVFFIKLGSTLPFSNYELDVLQNKTGDFLQISHVNYKGFDIVDVWCKHVFVKHPEIFNQIIQTYDL